MEIGTYKTIADLADHISGNLPRWKRNENFAWLCRLHMLLHEDGIWGWISGMEVWQKCGQGFVFLGKLTPPPRRKLH